ncbi:hypothetical protein PSP6_690098 [Paraburkholderia tropica]|nr:hypothetical protein PSP6_690098 [Paraburkholderia tropica]
MLDDLGCIAIVAGLYYGAYAIVRHYWRDAKKGKRVYYYW